MIALPAEHNAGEAQAPEQCVRRRPPWIEHCLHLLTVGRGAVAGQDVHGKLAGKLCSVLPRWSCIHDLSQFFQSRLAVLLNRSPLAATTYNEVVKLQEKANEMVDR